MAGIMVILFREEEEEGWKYPTALVSAFPRAELLFIWSTLNMENQTVLCWLYHWDLLLELKGC